MLRGTLGELHALREEVAPKKRPLAELPTPTLVRQALWDNGFEDVESSEGKVVQKFDSSREFLSHIHRLGLTGGVFSSNGALLSRGELERLMQIYDARCTDEDGNVTSSYCLGFFSARFQTGDS